jgi:hypothetical protein
MIHIDTEIDISNRKAVADRDIAHNYSATPGRAIDWSIGVICVRAGLSQRLTCAPRQNGGQSYCRPANTK